MTQELAESIKRLREIDEAFESCPTMALIARDAIRASHHQQAIQTINALVQLVGEMKGNLQKCTKWMEELRASGDAGFWDWSDDDEYINAQQTLTKSAPIAALAKEGEL